MATVAESKKACSVNPLKMSAPLGASFAFMGLDATMPVMHGSQGCTSFGLVLLVRHFKEAIPLQTTAMNEVTTIMGGYENIEKALLNIRTRAKPKLIAICSTGLTETKGDDVNGYLDLVRQAKPEINDTALLYVSTPDYVGGFEDGYGLAVTAIVKEFADVGGETIDKQVTVLPGSHLTPADIEEVRETIEAFGLKPIFVPDLSGSLDGHIPEDWRGTTLGGTPLSDMRAMGRSVATISIGGQVKPAADALQAKCGVPVFHFDRLTGLECNDRFLQALSDISGVPVPAKFRRLRSQLLDAMLDGHFYTGGLKVAIAAEPDLLFATGSLLVEMGAVLKTCIAPQNAPILASMPTEHVVIGDLEDLELGAADCDVLITHSHGRQAAERLNKPLFRIGFPIFDRIGNSHRLRVGYRGTRSLIFDVANLMMEQIHHAHPDTWPLPPEAIAAAAKADEAQAGGGCGSSCGCSSSTEPEAAPSPTTTETTLEGVAS